MITQAQALMQMQRKETGKESKKQESGLNLNSDLAVKTVTDHHLHNHHHHANENNDKTDFVAGFKPFYCLILFKTPVLLYSN